MTLAKCIAKDCDVALDERIVAIDCHRAEVAPDILGDLADLVVAGARHNVGVSFVAISIRQFVSQEGTTPDRPRVPNFGTSLHVPGLFILTRL